MLGPTVRLIHVHEFEMLRGVGNCCQFILI